MFFRYIRIPILIFVLVSCTVYLCYQNLTEAETTVVSPIDTAEKLIMSEKYYDAILALKPLLISDTKSEDQEEAFWLAHTVTINWQRWIFENGLWGELLNKKIETLNQLGANFNNTEINIGYRYGFLQRLIDTYPNSHKFPIAEYALIQSGYPVPLDIDKTLAALHAYIEKYENTGRSEVYRAYLDIAHIHHGLWSAITFSDNPDVRMYAEMGSGVLEKDKKLAESHREIALKYYAKYYINPHGLTDSLDAELNGETGYQLLKRKAEFGWTFIFWGC